MFRGLFINLDRKPERRRRMEAELRRFRLSSNYERLRAIDGHPGATGAIAAVIGCFRSHHKAMEIAKGHSDAFHIMEDDRILSGQLGKFLQSQECARQLRQFDLLFLDMWVEETSFGRFREAFARAGQGAFFLNMRGMRIGTAASYIVSPRSSGRIAVLMADEIARGPRMPVDTFYSHMVDRGLLTAGLAFPFLTAIDVVTGPESSIQSMDRSGLVKQAELRMSFFVDRQARLADSTGRKDAPAASLKAAPR